LTGSEATREQRDTGISATTLFVITVVGGTVANLTADGIRVAVKRAVDKFHEKFPDADVVTECDPDPSAEE